MPQIGNRGDVSQVSGPLKNFALAVSNCCDILSDAGVSLREIENILVKRHPKAKFPKSSTTIWAMTKGKQVRPSLELAQNVYDLAVEYAHGSARDLPAPGSIERLHEQVLLQAARGQACRSCGRPWEETGIPLEQALPPLPAEAVQPPMQDTRLPVAANEGDRQHSWDGLADLKNRLAADQAADAAGILRHTGLHATPFEAAAAIAACQNDGLVDAANAVIHHTSQRSADEVMQVLQILLANADTGSAEQLLRIRLEKL
ncbi:hypothetical protein [Actinoplanes cyaneus]|uniref:hypothetical protein n=1 Tax=Actinoplanes cyaneus TaxID=52696 RepID=UPI001942119D|nr:hypothetical protein [Actinoplanes cyaneus]